MDNDELILDAPIPGENYTSDVKNYPWHRPPDITSYDEAVEFAIEGLTQEEVGFTYMAMLEGGMSIATATDIYVSLGLANGKWTPDYAILLAGPVSRILEIMAKGYGIKAELGIDRKGPMITGAYMKALREGDKQVAEEISAAVEAGKDDVQAKMPVGGLMGAPMGAETAPEDEQLAMLGYGPEEGTEGDMPQEQEIQ